ncbi:MAG: type IV pilus inner membrane component PilO [Thermoleophilia bacterium]
MSRRNIYILAGLLLVVILVAYWFLLLSPLRAKIAEVDGQIETELNLLAQNQARLAMLEQIKIDSQRNEARLIELAKMVPQRTEIPSLLLQIQDLATESGIEFMTIGPGEPVQAGMYEIVPLSMQFVGSFFDVNDFMYRAEQMAAGPGRLLTVKTLTLAPSGEDLAKASPRLTVAMTLYAFQHTSPEALASAQ